MKVYMVSYGWEDTDTLLFANEEDAKKWVELFDGFLEEKEVWGNDAMNKGFYYCIKASANFDFCITVGQNGKAQPRAFLMKNICPTTLKRKSILLKRHLLIA